MQMQNNTKQKLSEADSIRIVRHMIYDNPSSNRTEISRLVCEHFDFHNAKDKPQQSGCLKALRELENPEHFILPALCSISQHKAAPKRLDQAVPFPIDVPLKAGNIIGLKLVQVSSLEQIAIWNNS
ncbi:MAG: hypothetical protein Q9M20_03310 [Mariprofundaceae bacterium]|nr:hypothetical protein [Mariprofundaceae bacterium]